VALAVCLLFSYLNPAHELRFRRLPTTAVPTLPVSLSHQVRLWREYERGSTVIADAYIKPLISSMSAAWSAACRKRDFVPVGAYQVQRR